MKASNLSFTTPEGRPVYLARLSITGTYEGHLERSPESISRYIRRDLTEHFRRQMPHVSAIVILDDGEDALPGLEWIAEFGCREAVHTTDPDYCSRLRVCWFTDNLPDSLTEGLEVALHRAGYETSAEDYDIML